LEFEVAEFIWSQKVCHPPSYSLFVLVTVVAYSGKFKLCDHSYGMPSSSHILHIIPRPRNCRYDSTVDQNTHVASHAQQATP